MSQYKKSLTIRCLSIGLCVVSVLEESHNTLSQCESSHRILLSDKSSLTMRCLSVRVVLLMRCLSFREVLSITLLCLSVRED
jgi:hypothetical protein